MQVMAALLVLCYYRLDVARRNLEYHLPVPTQQTYPCETKIIDFLSFTSSFMVKLIIAYWAYILVVDRLADRSPSLQSNLHHSVFCIIIIT